MKRGGNLERRHLVADIEELEEVDASELHARRFNAKEVLTPLKGDKFISPIADGTGRNPLIRDRPERGEEQGKIPGKSDGLYSPTLHQEDSRRDDAEAKNDFWSITGDFLSTSRGTQNQTVHAERRNTSYSAETHRRCQNHSFIT